MGVMNNLTKAGRTWQSAKQRERDAMADLYAAIVESYNSGIPETLIAKTAGVDRMTVRRALGKR